MTFIKLFIASLTGLLFACTYNSVGAKPSPFIHPQVTLLPYLDREPDEPLSLAEQLLEPWAMEIEVASSTGEAPQKVNRCDQFLAAEKSGKPIRAFEYAAYYRVGAYCQAVAWVNNMQAASFSYLGDLVVDKQLPKALPVEFAFVISEEEKAGTDRDNGFIPWAEAEPNLTFQQGASVYEGVYRSEGGEQVVSLLAKGDFNGDKLEDALFYVSQSVTGGTYTATRLLAVTRLQADDNLQVLGQFIYP